jgi:hypothetical protein
MPTYRITRQLQSCDILRYAHPCWCLVLLALTQTCLAADSDRPDLKSLYDAHRWFEAVIVRSGQEPVVVNLDIPSPEGNPGTPQPDPSHSAPGKLYFGWEDAPSANLPRRSDSWLRWKALVLRSCVRHSALP